jgi:hypothetical protein
VSAAKETIKPRFGDYDNDGYLDLYGELRALYEMGQIFYIEIMAMGL